MWLFNVIFLSPWKDNLNKLHKPVSLFSNPFDVHGSSLRSTARDYSDKESRSAEPLNFPQFFDIRCFRDVLRPIKSSAHKFLFLYFTLLVLDCMHWYWVRHIQQSASERFIWIIRKLIVALAHEHFMLPLVTFHNISFNLSIWLTPPIYSSTMATPTSKDTSLKRQFRVFL